MKTRIFDLEDRLVNFAVSILKLSQSLPKDFAGNHTGNQLVRSGISPALNYGEAQAAESSKDFIHKMKICLKELRETQVCLKIILQCKYFDDAEVLPKLNECGELFAIFTSSIKTAQKNA
ncbi:MAG: four helix bundle protein [Saprospiraceae bacterium]|nr:four helix bundle protein [Saprospiraceae bacterium]MCB9326364.1 four helix bundle protein [Lewinellaceae bacterium]